MTEEEAKGKWCPYARTLHTRAVVGGIAVTGINRGDGLPYCLGSACSQWRWEDPPVISTTSEVGDPGPGPEWSRAATIIDPHDPRIRWRRPFPNRRGYCGPAGKPEYD